MERGPAVNTSATGAVENVQNSGLFEKAARAGHFVSGLLHILIGYIAIRLAFGQGGNADQSGALAELGSKPGGSIALWVAVVAFVALALWRIMEAVVGKKSDQDSGSTMDRLKAGALAVVYIAFAWSTFGFASGSGKSSGQQNAGMTAKLMENGLGKFVLIVVGLVVIGVGGYHVYKGISKNFLDDLEGSHGKGVERLGIAGYAAKGIALVGAGALVVVAVFTSDPSKATGIDGAVKTLGSQPYGQVLLVLAGIGIALYGLYAFVLARYARM
jgi:succinate dehydrogenase/fumarate reductase cytochrome b subunit